MNIVEIRNKYPQYKDISDRDLADKLYSRFYSDMPEKDFYSKIGVHKDEGLMEGFVKPTLKAIPRVAVHTVASMAQMPVSGVAAGAKYISSGGNLEAANQVLEDNQKALDDFYLTTEAERQGSQNIGLAMKPFEMAGEGLQEIVKQTPLKGTIAEPIANTIGQASAMFGLGGAKGAAKARLMKDIGGLDKPLDVSEKPYSITPDVERVAKAEPPKEVAPEIKAKEPPAESVEQHTGVSEVTGGGKQPWEMTKEEWKNKVRERTGYQGLPEGADTSNIFHAQYLKGRHNVKVKNVDESYSHKKYEIEVSSPRTSTVKEATYYRDTDINRKYPQKRIYDSAVVDKDLRIIDKDYKNFDDVFPADRTPDEKFIYRGMSSPEFEQAINEGALKSRGFANLEGQGGETYFADNINQASSYASGFAPWYHAPSFEQPSYVIKVKKPSTAVKKGGGEVAVNESIPVKDIDKVYELRVSSESPGELDLIEDIYSGKALREGSSYGIRQNYIAREVPKSEWGDTFHKKQVKQALSEGKPVPESILKDYPDLLKAQEGVKAEIPKVETPIEGKPAKSAVDVNKVIAEKGFEALPDEELAKYNPITKADTISKIDTLLKADESSAIEMAKGNMPIPNDIQAQVLFNTVEKLAEQKGDIQTLMDLAKSPLAEQRSLSAQNLGASAWNKIKDTIVEKIQEVRKAREELSGKKEVRQKVREKVSKSLKDEVNKVNLSADELSWNKFLDKIVC